MMIAVIAVIALIFMSKRKNGISPVEPTKLKVHLATGKTIGVEIKKGQVLIPPGGSSTTTAPLPPGFTGKCPVGYYRNSILGECILDPRGIV